MSIFLKSTGWLTLFFLSLSTYGQFPTLTKTDRLQATCDPLADNLYGVRTPFGPGDRTIEICINKCLYRPAELEVVVFYAKTEAALSSVGINPSAMYGHGKARYVRTVGNVLRYEYTFPHSGFRDLNGSPEAEYKIIEMPSRDADKNPQKVYYRIGVKRTSAADLLATAATASFSMPDPITIGMVGDSYASGEGAPIQLSSLFTDPTQLWSDGDPDTNTDVLCHRSYLSGQAQAAEKVRLDNKKLAIAIKHVSCSGAVISELALQKQKKGNEEVPLQFEEIKSWLAKKGYAQLDILLMGIGGNDAGFAQAIVDFMLNPFGNFATDEDAKRRFSDPNHGNYPFNDLKAAYRQLNNDIWDGSFFNMASIGNPVIIHGYPSPCKGPSGNPWCGQASDGLFAGNTIGECWGMVEQDDKPEEFKAVHEIIVANLNKTVEEGAVENGWTFINLTDRAGSHGLSNCTEPFFNTIGQSLGRQGDVYGMIHPNANGYANMYVQPLSGTIQNQVNNIRSYWASLDNEDCTASEAQRLAAKKKQAIEAAKRAAKAKAQKRPYPLIKSYADYRVRYAQEVERALLDYKSRVKAGSIKLAPIPASPAHMKKIVDFSDKFSATKRAAF